MEIDLPEVVAEVTAAFDRYEKALVTNDVATLDAIFRNDPRTIRYGGAENPLRLCGDQAFRAARSPVGLARTISKTVITHLRPRPRRRLDALRSPLHARQNRPADADLGALSRRLARRRRARQRDRRAEVASARPRLCRRLATKARQPPKLEMSRAPATASASTRNPLTALPSASSSVPIESGGGTAATKRPKAASGSAQTSTSMAAPAPFFTRSRPGFGGLVPASA